MQHRMVVASDGIGAGGTPARCAAALYRSLLGSITRIADMPLCSTALDAEQASNRECVTTVYYCIEILLQQVGQRVGPRPPEPCLEPVFLACRLLCGAPTSRLLDTCVTVRMPVALSRIPSACTHI